MPAGVLCFVEADWPMFGGDFSVDGVDVLWPKKLAERLVPKEADLMPDAVEATFRALARALPSA